MPATTDTALTTGQAARALGVSEQTIRQWTRDGRLPAQITPLGALIDPAAVERLAAERERAATATRIRSRQIGRRTE